MQYPSLVVHLQKAALPCSLNVYQSPGCAVFLCLPKVSAAV